MVYWFYLIFQIRNALEKERESTDRERVRHQAKLEEIRDKYESALKQVREELEAERQGHTHLNTSVNKIKKVCKTFSSFMFGGCRLFYQKTTWKFVLFPRSNRELNFHGVVTQ